MQGLLAAVEAETFHARPAAKVGAMVAAWNRLSGIVPDWSSTELVIPRRKAPWTIPLDQFPASFQADVALWLERLALPDPLGGGGPPRPLRPATLDYHRFGIRQMASAILRGSDASLEEARDLGWMVELDRLKSGLRFLMARNGSRPTEAIQKLAVQATAIARHHVRADSAQLEALKALCRRLKVEVSGLREKNRHRLAQLDDERNLVRLLHLPARLEDEAQRSGLGEYRRALLIAVALAIEILLHAPLRIGNLSRLSLDRHIRRARVKGRDCLLIEIPGAEVKNGRNLAFELTDDSLALYDRFLSEHRPVLLGAPSEYLFAARNGGPKRPSALSELIKATILRYTGLTIHPHLFRSIAGKIHAMIRPGDYVTLGHAIGDSLRTTMKAYAQFEQQAAVRHYQASVAAARRRLM